MKWNESGFNPPFCTYRLNWARRTSWGWWDDWDDTVLETQDSKFEPWRSEAEHATSRSRRLPAILTFTRGWGRNIFVSFKPPSLGTEPRALAWKAAVLTTTLGPPPTWHTMGVYSGCSRYRSTSHTMGIYSWCSRYGSIWNTMGVYSGCSGRRISWHTMGVLGMGARGILCVSTMGVLGMGAHDIQWVSTVGVLGIGAHGT